MTTRPGDPRQFSALRHAPDPVRAYKDQIDAMHLQLAAANARIAELEIVGRGLSISLDATRRRLAELETDCTRCASTGDDWTDFLTQRGKYAPRRQA